MVKIIKIPSNYIYKKKNCTNFFHFEKKLAMSKNISNIVGIQTIYYLLLESKYTYNCEAHSFSL